MPSRPNALPLVILSVLIGLMVGPLVLPIDRLRQFPYDPRDAFIFLWDFWWTGRALGELRSPFWTDLLLHPAGASLAFHSFPLPYCLASVPVQLMIPGPAGLVVAFNLVVLTSFALCALGAYRLALHVTGSRWTAVVAACAYTFAPFRVLNVPRLHVLATELLPFATLCWLQFLERPGKRRALQLGLWLALALYTSQEYALFLCLLLGLSLASEVVSLGRRGALRDRLPGLARGLVIAGASSLLLAAPLLAAQVSALSKGSAVPARSLDEVREWSPALLSFIIPSRLHPIHGTLLRPFGEYRAPGLQGMRSETSIALSVWLLAAWAIARVRGPRTRVWVLASVVFLALALGPELRLTGGLQTGIAMPFQLAYQLLPPLRACRDSTRLLPVALLGLSVLSALGATDLARRGRVGRAVAIALGALVVYEDMPSRPASIPAEQLMPPLYRAIEPTASGSILDLSSDFEAMLGQTVHAHPISAGKAAVPRAAAALEIPGEVRAFLAPEQVLGLDEPRRTARLRQLHQWLTARQVRYLVLPQGDSSQLRLAQAIGAERVETAPFLPAQTSPARQSRHWSAAATLVQLPRPR